MKNIFCIFNNKICGLCYVNIFLPIFSLHKLSCTMKKKKVRRILAKILVFFYRHGIFYWWHFIFVYCPYLWVCYLSKAVTLIMRCIEVGFIKVNSFCRFELYTHFLRGGPVVFRKKKNSTISCKLTLLLRTLGQRIKNEYCPTKKSTSDQHNYT